MAMSVPQVHSDRNFLISLSDKARMVFSFRMPLAGSAGPWVLQTINYLRAKHNNNLPIPPGHTRPDVVLTVPTNYHTIVQLQITIGTKKILQSIAKKRKESKIIFKKILNNFNSSFGASWTQQSSWLRKQKSRALYTLLLLYSISDAFSRLS